MKARLGDDWSVEAVPLESQIGSGAQPTTRLPSAGLALTPRGAKGRALEHLAQTLRALPTPVLGRITQDAFVLDVRTLADASLLAALGDHPSRHDHCHRRTLITADGCVRALTGVETDRLAEEQRQGLTIELGYAYGNRGDTRWGFVDVPGHERFMATSLAGLAAAPAF